MIMALLLALTSVCSPAQLTEAGRRVQGKGAVEQAWILAQVGCPDLAERSLDAIVSQSQGQYRLHALFTRGRVAILRCQTACTPGQRAAGRDAFRRVEQTATAPAQVKIAQAMAVRLAPVAPPAAPPVVRATPVSKPARPPQVARIAPATQPPRTETASSTRKALWITAGIVAVGAGASGYVAWRDAQETHRLSAARNAFECDGRAESTCRRAWQESLDSTRIYTGVSIGLGALALGLGLVAEWNAGWSQGAASLTAGPEGARIQGVW